MIDPKAEIYDRYLAAWSPVSPEERERLLHASVVEDVLFENPTQTRRGLADLIVHLEGFQQRIPSGAFRMNNMVGWGDRALAEWQLVDVDGVPGFSGYDGVTFDAAGLISSILLFGNVEAQKLAWRTRDPVSLSPTA